MKPMSQNYQILQYLFITILCAKMVSVTWALIRLSPQTKFRQTLIEFSEDAKKSNWNREHVMNLNLFFSVDTVPKFSIKFFLINHFISKSYGFRFISITQQNIEINYLVIKSLISYTVFSNPENAFLETSFSNLTSNRWGTGIVTRNRV